MPSKLLALVLTSLVALAACAAEADRSMLTIGAEAAALVRAAPDTAAEVTTARFELAVEVVAGAEAVTMRATGAVDRPAGRLGLDLELPSLGAVAPAGGDTSVQVVMDGGTTYVRMPLLTSLTGTDGWLALDSEAVAGFDESGLLDPGTADPTATLEVLREVADRVERLGEDRVRGVPTTRYRAEVDLEAVMGANPAASRFLALGDPAASPDLRAVPVEVWLDDAGLVHRLVVTLAAEGEPVSASLTLELFDHGQPVDIAVPPADQVTPGDGLTGSLRDAFLGAGA